RSASYRDSANGIVCAGNWIVDIVHSIDHWPKKNDLARISDATLGIGGGAANVTTNLAELSPDLSLFPVGCIGHDDYGRFVLEHLKRLNVGMDHLVQLPDVETAHTHVMNVVGESRTFFYAGGANDKFSQAHVDIASLARHQPKLFYLGYIMLLEQMDLLRADGRTSAAEILGQARENGMITCVDLVSAAHAEYSKIVAASAPYIDYLVLNETEAARATGIENSPDMKGSLSKAGRTLIASGVNEAVVIHIPGVAMWADANGDEFWVTAAPIAENEIISPVGAGDAFCSGILFGIHEGLGPERTMKLAHTLAAANLKVPTANGGIPHKDELPALIGGPIATNTNTK
ncbi:MAG: carbohydrate kinase family protein, partial [Hyphomicrobiales bacterium]